MQSVRQKLRRAMLCAIEKNVLSRFKLSAGSELSHSMWKDRASWKLSKVTFSVSQLTHITAEGAQMCIRRYINPYRCHRQLKKLFSFQCGWPQMGNFVHFCFRKECCISNDSIDFQVILLSGQMTNDLKIFLLLSIF